MNMTGDETFLNNPGERTTFMPGSPQNQQPTYHETDEQGSWRAAKIVDPYASQSLVRSEERIPPMAGFVDVVYLERAGLYAGIDPELNDGKMAIAPHIGYEAVALARIKVERKKP